MYLGQQTESYSSESAQQNVSSTRQDIEEVNTMSPKDFGWGFQYFYDSAKQEQAYTRESLGLYATTTTKHYFWVFAFSLNVQIDNSDTIKSHAKLSPNGSN